MHKDPCSFKPPFRVRLLHKMFSALFALSFYDLKSNASHDWRIFKSLNLPTKTNILRWRSTVFQITPTTCDNSESIISYGCMVSLGGRGVS